MNFLRWIRGIKLPLIVICGPTGSGKSKLAIEIAKECNGEIINCDAIQVYKGMDILTNKVTENEQNGIKHHLLGFKDIETLDYSIHDFQKNAIEIINEIKNRNKTPVLVGGTCYYIDSILWHTLVKVRNDCPEMISNRLDAMCDKELHEYLRSVDPGTAALLHPNNRRKVLRAVKISLNSTDNRHSHLEKQNKSRRFALNETVFLWVDTEKQYLIPRLERRVDLMMANGLLSELEELEQLFLKLNSTKGIFQSIGFKQFRSYFEYADKESDAGRRILSQCVDLIKLANRQYAQFQIKWIKSVYLKNRGEGRNIPLFKVDTSDLTRWDEMVLQRSLNIIKDVSRCTAVTKYSDFVQQLNIIPEPLSQPEIHTPCYKVCEICDNQVFITYQRWDMHTNSSKHKRRIEKLQRQKIVSEK